MHAPSPPAPNAPLTHLLIDGCAPAQPGGPALPPLPQLHALLRLLRPSQRLRLPPDSLHSPAERLLAQWHQLPGEPGRWPLAAHANAIYGTPCAWLRPAHLALGLDSMALMPPADLLLSADESRALLADCAPLLAEDGLRVQWQAPDRWLAQGALLQDISAPAPEHAAGLRLARRHLPQAATPQAQRRLARLGAELEMLLANHPVNQARQDQGQPPINTLWLHGAGLLSAPAPQPPGQRLHSLRLPAPPQQAPAWQAIEREHAPALLARAQAGQPVALSLCGPQTAITLSLPAQAWWQRLLPRPRGAPLAHWLAQASA